MWLLLVVSCGGLFLWIIGHRVDLCSVFFLFKVSEFDNDAFGVSRLSGEFSGIPVKTEMIPHAAHAL